MKTAFFDMDGTLLDTEVIYQKYWKIASDELGYDLTDKQLLMLRSLGHSYGVELLKDITGDEKAYDAIRARRQKLMDPVMESGEFPLKPTVHEALGLLRESGVRLAVATATRLDRTENYLRRAGLIDYFDELISARQVEHGKPSPEVYLYACKRMGVDPADAFAMEDAPNGIRSAAGAGCKAIMVPDLTQPDEDLLSLITYTAENLLDAAEYIVR